MARDPGLEELLRDLLTEIPDLSERPMFGGLAWLFQGHLLCAARDDGALLRLGKAQEAEALKSDGIEPMMSRGRIIGGWVRLCPEIAAEDVMMRGLIEQALSFIRSLPPKS
ncbi:TfoX/Sxy family protein [Novosphingobium terrae]|uniref:TfoX/Sxy family protein n=1 Tax=Novosphingobium terrae TaxID=2726189 RepID=UPI00197DB5C1|nr:TfoX/Sxy family protein [Novosphingobium terrae]